MSKSLLLLYIDSEQLGDTMFVKELAGRLAKWDASGPYRMIVHGSGPQTEQALENKGLFIDRQDEVFPVSSGEEQATVERSIRATNRRIVSLMTNQQVVSVSIQGVDRGLLHRNPDGGVRTGSVEWLEDLMAQYVTPVISALGKNVGTGEVCELPASSTVSALVRALQNWEPTVVFFTTVKGMGIRRGGQWMEAVHVDELQEDDPVTSPEIIRMLVTSGISVLVTSGRGLTAEEGVRGTEILPPS